MKLNGMERHGTTIFVQPPGVQPDVANIAVEAYLVISEESGRSPQLFAAGAIRVVEGHISGLDISCTHTVID
jgi:hypothetical protein